MPLKKQSTASLLALVLLAGLLAGCGGGDQAGSGSQGGAEKQGEEKQGQTAKKESAAETKIAIGTVISVKPDRGKLVLRPAEEVQGGKRMTFKVLKKARITLADKKVELAEAKKGQQAQIEYVVKDERNRARTVLLFERE